jgi:hypothetical protein
MGSSLGVVLPQEAINRLAATQADRLLLREGPSNTYQLTRYKPAFEKKMKKIADIIRRYRGALRTLAK